jgi:hypothetical protein
MGEGIADTCHESYQRSDTGLGPDYFWFDNGVEAMSISLSDR